MKKTIFSVLLFCVLLNLNALGTVTFIMKNYSAQTGTQITIPVKVTGFNSVLSIQGTVQFDQTKLQFVSVQDFGALPMLSGDFGTTMTSTGKLTFAWVQSAMQGVTLSDSTTIFSIKFNVIGSPGQNSLLEFVNSPTPFEVIDPTMSPISYALVNGSVTITPTVSIEESISENLTLLQNSPNPFTSETNIIFSLPVGGVVNIYIYDFMGNRVAFFEKYFESGKNSLIWETGDLQSGPYFYRVSWMGYSGTGKMLLIN